MSDLQRLNRLREKVRRSQGVLECVLGDGNGNVPAGKSRYWVRFTEGVNDTGKVSYSKPLPIRYAGEGAILEADNVEVLIKFDYDDVLSIFRVSPTFYERSEIDSRSYNPTARNRSWIRTRDITRWATRPVGSNAGSTSTLITRRENPAFVDDYLNYQTDAGTILAAAKPDLASLIPAAGYHCRVCVFYDILAETHFAAASTAQTLATALDDTDIDECFEQLEHNEYVPLLALTLADNQSSIDINDYYRDLRQFVNAPRIYGFPNPLPTGKAIVIRSTHQEITYDLTVAGDLTVEGDMVIL
jgi:hypothetical protein